MNTDEEIKLLQKAIYRKLYNEARMWFLRFTENEYKESGNFTLGCGR